MAKGTHAATLIPRPLDDAPYGGGPSIDTPAVAALAPFLFAIFGQSLMRPSLASPRAYTGAINFPAVVSDSRSCSEP